MACFLSSVQIYYVAHSRYLLSTCQQNSCVLNAVDARFVRHTYSSHTQEKALGICVFRQVFIFASLLYRDAACMPHKDVYHSTTFLLHTKAQLHECVIHIIAHILALNGRQV